MTRTPLHRSWVGDQEVYVIRHEPLDVICVQRADEMYDNPSSLEDILEHPNCTPGMANLVRRALGLESDSSAI